MGLLVAIAILLGALIAMLPESIERVCDTPAGVRATERPDRPEPQTDDDPYPSVPDDSLMSDREQPAPQTQPDRPAPPVPPAAEGTAAAQPWWLPPAAVPPERRGPLVLVLDDAGNSLEAYEEFLRFPGPMAVAVLPRLDFSVHAAALAAAAGKEIMLHQPMEALRGGDPGPGSIGLSDPPERIVEAIRENLRTVPGAIGVNNHMGSLATADAELMRTVLAALHEQDLFFLDSRTSAETVGRLVAAEVGIPFAERTVFLDNSRTRESILSALGHALELSHRGEPVVMIGHVTVPLLADILLEVYPVLDAHGYEFVPVSQLVRPVSIAQGDEQ